MKLKIKVKTFGGQTLPKIINKGEWIDLRANIDSSSHNKGDIFIIPLGVGMILPDGFEAIIAPRSSTPKNFGIMCANSFGVIDNSYSGNEDEWKFPAYVIEKKDIHTGDRICQFRIQLSQKATFWQKLKWLFSSGIEIEIVEKLNTINRGGIGSTGKK